MKNTTHTPGPWEWSECGTENAVVYIGDQTIGGVYKGSDEDILSPSDARLIATAPDLLEACKAALRANPYGVKFDGKWDDWRDQISAAISKAEGNS